MRLPDPPVATTPWWVTTRIDDRITHVTEPHASPLLRCNVWHVRGRDRDLVVDTGLGVSPLRHLVEHELDHPLVAVATHVHYDHSGGLWEFDERVAHPDEAGALLVDDPAPLAAADIAGSLIESLGDWVEGPYLLDALPHSGFQVHGFRRRAAPVTRTVDEGDVIDLGDCAFEVLHLPGHSPGSIGLWEPSTGTFFSGDAVYDEELLDELPGSDVAAYVATMRRLRELPVEVVHAGHEPSFGRERLVELCDGYLATRT